MHFYDIFLIVVCLRVCGGYVAFNATGQNNISSLSNSCISCKDKWACDSDSNKSFPDKGCYCDKLCGVMNDCCSNFNLDDSKIAGRFNKSMFECRRHPEDHDNYDYGVYFVDKCPAKWQNEEVRQLCEGNEMYSDFIENIKESRWISAGLGIPLNDLLRVTVIEHLTGVIYKNPFCAYCHGDIDDAFEWQTQIYNEIEHSEDKKPYSIHELIDGKLHNLVNKHTYRLCWLPLEPDYCPRYATMKDKDDCLHGEFAAVYDSSGNLYRNIHCAFCNNMPCDELQCESPVNISVISSRGLQIWKRPENVLYDYVSTACLFISVPSLVLTILTFLIFAPLRTRKGGQIKLCLMISFLLTQLFVLVLDTAKTANMLTCRIFAVITHYLLLVTFCWMNVLALDICTTVSKQRAIHITVTKRKMLLYCLFAIGAPFIVVSVSFLLDLLRVDTRFNPKYGTRDQCWLSTGESMLLFFLGPLSVCKAFDFIVFIITTVTILNTQKRASKYGQRHGRSMCSILDFLKLSLIMTLSWLIALFENLIDDDAMLLFMLFNFLQGLLIFLCLCCNRTVLNLWISECSRLMSYIRESDLRSRLQALISVARNPVTLNPTRTTPVRTYEMSQVILTRDLGRGCHHQL